MRISEDQRLATSDLPGHTRVWPEEQILLHEGCGEIPALEHALWGTEMV